MVQTMRTTDGPQVSLSQQQEGGGGTMPALPRMNELIPPTFLRRGTINSNYNKNSTTASCLESE